MANVKVAIWVLQEPSSPKQKVYVAGAWVDPATGDAVFCTGYGGHSQLQNLTLRIMDETEASRAPIPRVASRIADEFVERMVLKEQRGYNVVLASPRVITVDTTYIDPETFMRDQALNAANGDGIPAATAYDAVAEALSSANTPLVTPTPAGATPPPPPTLVSTATSAVTMPDGTDYYPRMIGGVTDVDLLRTARDLQSPVGLYGESGTGKSTVPLAAFGDDLIIVQGHGNLSVADVVGQYIPTPPGQASASGFTWVDGPLLTAMKEGRPILFDEFTRAPSETVAVMFSPMDFRRALNVDALGGQQVAAADGFFVLASWNEAGVGVAAIDDALLRRFPIRVHVTNDYDAAARRGVETRLVRVGQNLATVRAQQIADGNIPVWAPSVATLLDVQKVINAGLGDQFAADMLLTACPELDRDQTVIDAISTALGVVPNVLTLGATA